MRYKFLSLCLILLLSSVVLPTAYTQDDSPAIDIFTSTLQTVDRNALTTRTARVPVSWRALNRPLLANLIFEQVLPDNSVVNVELPRLIPWVNSEGNGIAAPVLPAVGASNITLRVRLTNIITGETYDKQEFTLAISEDGSGSGGTEKIPTLKTFATTFTGKLNRDQLAGTALRLPVSWEAIHRPTTANLVFEQVLPDGTVKNVELPRENPWVNSTGSGVVAPVNPGDGINRVTLRVRLIDLLYGRIYDRRLLTIPIAAADEVNPNIDIFSTGRSAVERSRLLNGTELVDVAWSVSNRPGNSNLVFEQVLPDGRVRSAELPRDFDYVSSSGNGIVSLTDPGSGTNEVRFRIRLVALNSGVTLDTAELNLPILNTDEGDDDDVVNGTVITVNGAACYQAPFLAANGVTVGETARMRTGTANIFATMDAETVIATGQYNQTYDVLDGPHCIYIDGTAYSERLWQVRAQNGGTQGWVKEYIQSDRAPIIQLIDDDTHDAGGNRIVTGDACYQAPFPTNYGLMVGDEGRVLTLSGGAPLAVYSKTDGAKKADLQTGDTFTIEEGPYCTRTILPDSTYHNRQWRISSDDTSGWVYEYNLGRNDAVVRLIAGTEEDDNPVAQVVTFSVTPDTITPANLTDGTTVTFTWQTQNAMTVRMVSGDFLHETPEVNGSITVPVSELDTSRNPIPITLTAENTSFNYDSQELGVQVETELRIESFTVSPESGLVPGNVVTLTWNINGTLQPENPGGIWWTPEHYRYTLQSVATLNSNSGSVEVTIPETAYGERVFTLSVLDESGAEQRVTASITVDCPPVAFFVSDPPIEAVHCVREPISTAAAYQRFENGFMLWVEASDQMYAIYDNGVAVRHSDMWDGSDYEISDTPPEGLLKPERGFGYTWQLYDNIRTALGWANAPETAYMATLQSTRAYGRYQTTYEYLTLPDGRTIRVKHETGGSTWRFVG